MQGFISFNEKLPYGLVVVVPVPVVFPVEVGDVAGLVSLVFFFSGIVWSCGAIVVLLLLLADLAFLDVLVSVRVLSVFVVFVLVVSVCADATPNISIALNVKNTFFMILQFKLFAG